MAASITTQADILIHTTIGDNELSRLTTARMESDNWLSMHTKAWTLIKDMLLDKRPFIEEDTLDTPTQLSKVTCYAVLYLAYQEAQIISDEDSGRKQYWFRKMRKEFSRVKLTVDGVVIGRESYAGMRSLRG